MLVKFFCNTCVWVALMIVAFVLCIDIEYEWILFPGFSKGTAEATNRIILALSYSYIVAGIFHFFVNYCPNKYRSQKLSPFVNHKIWIIKESLHQCKMSVLPVFDLRNEEFTKKEYLKIFSTTDFYEEFALAKGQTKFYRIEFYRDRICDTISILLEYREFISDETFEYLTSIQTSLFIVNGLCPFNKDGDNYYCNQDSIGECIYDLYEQAKKIK